VDRQEQEYNRLRQEKKQLHHAAMDAWQQGEISHALTKLALVLELDRRAPDSSSPERASYQNLYDQVRSEHDALNNAYAEMCKFRADGNLTNALQLCDTWMSKYPNNALFQALKFDLEEQKRQELSAFIATVDRQVEGEPDLDKRVGVLKEALKVHPDEAHFQRALRLVEDKRDLVNSIVARAHFHEEQQQFGDALGDWEILRTIYNRYPGLSFEIERLEKRRENQSRIEAKTRFAEQIDACLKSASYARALELLQQAEPEFPNDPELAELKKAAEAGLQQATEVQRLMTEGQGLCAQGQFAEGVRLLRQAHELDEKNPVPRSVLFNTLIERAQQFVENDWQAAEDLIQQAFELNPGHPLARNLQTVVLDRKRDHLVNECFSQARRLRAAADFAGAITQIEQALATYPNERRLLQTRENLQSEMAEAERVKKRSRDLEELRNFKREAEKTPDLAIIRSYRDRAKTLAASYTDDAEIRSLVSGLEQLAKPTGKIQPKPSTSATNVAQGAESMPSATLLFSPGAVVAKPQPQPSAKPGMLSGRSLQAMEVESESASPATQSSARPRTASAASSFFSNVRSSVQARWASRPSMAPVLSRLSALHIPLNKLNKKIAGVAAGVLVLLLAMTWMLVKVIHHRPSEPAVVASVSVHIHASPPGAAIRINNEVRGTSDLDVSLPFGTYQIEAQLDGYQTAQTGFEARSGAPGSVDLTLQPILPVVKLTVDTGTGKVLLDDQAAFELDGAQWTADHLAPGPHQLKFSGPKTEASFAFTAAPGAVPVISGPLSAKGVHAVVVSNSANRLHVYYSDPHAKVSLDTQPEVEIGDDGIDIPNVTPGPHQLNLSQGSDHHNVAIDVGAAPTLTAFLVSDQDIGTLLVVTGEGDAQVYLNNQLQKKTTNKDGQLRIPNLAPKNYTVRVVKNGFQNPPEQQIAIHKGDSAKLNFGLAPVLHAASLAIDSVAAGTTVLLDGVVVGTADGRFRFPTVTPGDHVIELRRDHFNPKTLHRHFSAGATVTVSASEAAMEAATGQLKITFTPPDAVVTITKEGEAPTNIVSGTPVAMAPGSYQLMARVGNFPRTAPVEVVAGATVTLSLALAPGGMQDFADASGWKSDQGWFVHRGGGFLLNNAPSTAGTFQFSAILDKGKLLQWVFNYTDDRNYELFQMDENNFMRSQVRDGKKTEEAKVSFKTDKKKSRTFQITVTPNRIVHQIQQGNGWAALDSWNASDGTSGKFGFYLPGNDEIKVSNFSHYGDLKLR
jgi:tetratricopeptide (TPR) repeat protein